MWLEGFKKWHGEIVELCEAPALTTEERNIVCYFWSQLHWTLDEFEEYSAIKTRMEDIRAAGEAIYLGAPENREYANLSKRSTELLHSMLGKRLVITHAIRDRVWPELAPRVLRYRKLEDKPQLTNEEVEEVNSLLEWFSNVRKEVLEAVEKVLSPRPGREPT